MGQEKPINCGATLRALIDRSGLKYTQAATMAGFKKPSSITRYIDKTNRPQPFKIDIIKRFERVLVGKGVPPITRDEIYLLSGFDKLVTPEDPAPNVLPDLTRSRTMPQPSNLSDDVPVMGIAVGGTDDNFAFNGQVRVWAKRPLGAAKNKDVFCVYLSGDSMQPKFKAGALLYINPARPARMDEYVLVEMHPKAPGEPGFAYVKLYEARTATKLILRQHNPDKRIELPLDRVLRVMPVMEQDELIG